MIELESIKKSYRDLEVLRSLCLKIGEGEFCAIQGPSGSGKSTLLNLIGLLDRPTMGALRIDGQDVAELSAADLARVRNLTHGFVFQSFNLLPRLEAWENVALPLLYRRIVKRERRARAMAMLERVGLGDRLHHRPAELSGGQCQRVAIARALVGTPKLILADEPTGSLDSQTAREIMDLLEALNNKIGITIVIVTHDESVASRCRRRITINDGVIMGEH